jgi:CrcB protein
MRGDRGWAGVRRGVILVFVGGGAGSALRAGSAVAGSHLVGLTSLPVGILVANLVAALGIGLVVPLSAPGGPLGAGARMFLVTGILGGLSTFSTLIGGTLQLESRPETRGLGLAYLAVSLVAGLGLVRVGEAIGRWVRRDSGSGGGGPATSNRPSGEDR